MTTAASGSLLLRVMVEDVWDAVNLQVPATTPVGDVKAMALRKAGVPGEPSRYVAKFRGAELDDGYTVIRAAVPRAAWRISGTRRTRR